MSNITVRTGAELQQAIKITLDEYKGLTIDALKKAVDDTAKETVQNNRSKSPKRTGVYAKSWASKTTTSTSGVYGKTVYSKKPGLPHLLEHGHTIKGWVTKYTAKTRTRAIPHIQSDDETEKLLESKLRKALNDT